MKVNNKNKYNQLTSEERDKIATLRAEGKSLTLIATFLVTMWFNLKKIV